MGCLVNSPFFVNLRMFDLSFGYLPAQVGFQTARASVYPSQTTGHSQGRTRSR